MAELARGTVVDRPWGRTFATLGLRAVTGQLALVSDGKRFLVAFERGAVVAAASPLASDAAVRVALTTHLVSSSQVPEISRRQAAAPERDEVELIAELARLGPDHALRLRRRVIAQRAARTFSINHGEFVVTDDTELTILDGCELDVRAVVYIGARSNLPEQRLSAELHQLGAWFRLRAGADDDLPQFGFGDVEQPVIERLRDGGTLAEIDEFATSFVDSRTVRAVIYALAACGACDLEPAPGQPRGKLTTPRTISAATAPFGLPQARPPSRPISRPGTPAPPDVTAPGSGEPPLATGEPPPGPGEPRPGAEDEERERERDEQAAASAGESAPAARQTRPMRYGVTQPLPVAGEPAVHARVASSAPSRAGRPTPSKETTRIATVPPPARGPAAPTIGGAGVVRPDFSRAGMRASSDAARREGTTGPIRVPTREGLRAPAAAAPPPFGEPTRRERPSASERIPVDDASAPSGPVEGAVRAGGRRLTPPAFDEATRRERPSASGRAQTDDGAASGRVRSPIRDAPGEASSDAMEAMQRETPRAGIPLPIDRERSGSSGTIRVPMEAGSASGPSRTPRSGTGPQASEAGGERRAGSGGSSGTIRVPMEAGSASGPSRRASRPPSSGAGPQVSEADGERRAGSGGSSGAIRVPMGSGAASGPARIAVPDAGRPRPSSTSPSATPGDADRAAIAVAGDGGWSLDEAPLAAAGSGGAGPSSDASAARLRPGSSPGADLPGAGPRFPARRPTGSRLQPRSVAGPDSTSSRDVEALIAQRLALLDRGADHFELLGVSRDVPPEPLRKAYFALARQLHPDRLAALGLADDSKHAQRLFAQVNAAFATLNDPERRARYVDVLRRGGEAAVRAEQARAEELTRRVLESEEAFRRGEQALRRDRPQAAVIELERALELNPDEADYHATLAWARFCAASDKPSIADVTRAELERALQLQPRSVTARFYLGRVDRMLGRDAEALRRFRDVVADSPGHAEAAAEIRALESRLGPDKPGAFGRSKR